MYKVVCFILILSLSLLISSAPVYDNLLNQKTIHIYCAAEKLKNTVNELISKCVAVKMPYEIDNSLNMSDTTCEIHAAAFLLKTKLIHYVNHNKTDTGNNTDTKCVNPSDVNIIQLLDKVHIYLEIIANTLWQIYDLLGINKACMKFITDQNLEKYNVTIEFKSNLSLDNVTGDGSIHFFWNSKDEYSNNLSLPSLPKNFTSSDCNK